MKYIMFKIETPLLLVFNKHIIHKNMYEIFLDDNVFGEDTTAGFVSVSKNKLNFYGESESLGISSHVSDNDNVFTTLNYVIIEAQWKADIGISQNYSFVFLFSGITIEDFLEKIIFIKLGSHRNWTRLKALPHIVKYQGIVELKDNSYKCDIDEVNNLLMNSI